MRGKHEYSLQHRVRPGPRQKARVWTKCLDIYCGDCRLDYATCVACKEKHVLHSQQCVSCDMSVANNALVEQDSHAKCVDTTTAPYKSGYE